MTKMENKKQKENTPNIPDTLVSYVTGKTLAAIRTYKYGIREDKVGVESTRREIKAMLAKMRQRKISEQNNQQ